MYRAMIAFLALTLGACSCEKSQIGDGGTDIDGGNDDGSVQPDGGGGDGGSGDADGGDGGPLCVGGTLCGTPATCCEAGNECISGACLPTCASGVRCGTSSEICCTANELCISNACETPTTNCMDSYDCEIGEFCEPTIGRCVSQPPGGPSCEYAPVFSTLEPEIERGYVAEEIISIPVVANLDGVGGPEIAVNLSHVTGGFDTGNILVLNGDSAGSSFTSQGTMLLDDRPTSYGSHGRTTIAVGDVTGDEIPEIVYVTSVDGGTSRVAAVSISEAGAYTLRWTSFIGTPATPFTMPAANVANVVVTLANFDDDAMAEVVVGGVLLDHDGRLMWQATGGVHGCYDAACGTNDGYVGGVAVVADLDDDGHPEIITGRNAFKVAWTQGSPPTAVVTPYWQYSGNDGYPAVANMDNDALGKPEVVLVASGRVVVLNGQTGALFCGIGPNDAACTMTLQRTQPLNIVGTGRGGPPTIADFDGDGRPEIGVAGGSSYAVYDLNRPGEVIAQPNGNPAPAAGALFVRWSRTTQDGSSNATGSSVFDFQGDGAAEVVYADECYMRVYSGTDGTVQLETPSTSATIHEYPLVVDADGDGNSEILLVANDSHATNDCGNGVPARRGLFMYGDMNDEWVPTRRVWTQHSYQVTNATSAGNVPLSELPNWMQPGLNNARQNVQGDGVFNAPDLAVDVSIGLDQCTTSHVIRARVTNLGALGVYMGVPIRFERTTGGNAVELGISATTIPLLPGQSQVVALTVQALTGFQDYRVTVDYGSGMGMVNECNEGNNTGETTGADCGVIIE